MRNVLICALLSAVVISSTLGAHNTNAVPQLPYRSNGFFVSYYADEFFGIGELEAREQYYRCTVEDLTLHVSLCDTTWVLEWWEAEDTTDLDLAVVFEDLGGLPGLTLTPNYFYGVERSPDEPLLASYDPFTIPNDSLFPAQWHMQEDHLNMPCAWAHTLGSPEVIIGILDTGVWFAHEDLRDNIWINPGEDLDGDGAIQPEEVNGVDDDENGYPDDFCGWDWVDEDNNPRHALDDVDFHGTRVAGVSSATTNNHIGVAGVGWNCRFVPLRAGSRQGLYLEYIIPAMLYSVQEGIDVLNCSWYNYYDNPVLSKLTECLYDEGTVVVACAGNNNMDRHAYPASYDWVVGVAATDSDNTIASFSNYGEWIHLAAPGVSILTTSAYVDSCKLRSYYSYRDGTSFSTPMVSAAAALVKSMCPYWSPGQIISRLYETSDPVSDQNVPPWRLIAGGILNVYSAVNIPEIDVDPMIPYQEQ